MLPPFTCHHLAAVLRCRECCSLLHDDTTHQHNTAQIKNTFANQEFFMFLVANEIEPFILQATFNPLSAFFLSQNNIGKYTARTIREICIWSSHPAIEASLSHNNHFQIIQLQRSSPLWTLNSIKFSYQPWHNYQQTTFSCNSSKLFIN